MQRQISFPCEIGQNIIVILARGQKLIILQELVMSLN